MSLSFFFPYTCRHDVDDVLISLFPLPMGKRLRQVGHPAKNLATLVFVWFGVIVVHAKAINQ